MELALLLEEQHERLQLFVGGGAWRREDCLSWRDASRYRDGPLSPA